MTQEKEYKGRKLLKAVNNAGEITISWSEGNKTLSMKCNELPDPAFVLALQDLDSVAIANCPFIAEDYHNKTHALGCQFDWKGDSERRNAEVLVAIQIVGLPSVKIKTPKKLADLIQDEKKKPRYDADACHRFDMVTKQAFAYVDGQRAQIALKLDVSQDEKDAADAEINQELAL